MDRTPVTPEGYRRLLEALEAARRERHKVMHDIEEARAHGDISENAEYEDAKHRQAMLEGRIRFLETQVASAEVIDVRKAPSLDRVVFGATVDLLDLDEDREFSVRIVGTEEASPQDGSISWRSPLARALLGREEGEEVTVRTPKGRRQLEIVAIRAE